MTDMEFGLWIALCAVVLLAVGFNILFTVAAQKIHAEQEAEIDRLRAALRKAQAGA